MRTMYKSMLNKFVEPKPRDLVDYDVYMERQKRKTFRVPAEEDVTEQYCENSFVLFYSDLREQARLFGLLEHGSAHDLWAIIMKNVEIEVEEDTSDAEGP